MLAKEIREAYIHPTYETAKPDGKLENSYDIALIELKDKFFELGDLLKPSCLDIDEPVGNRGAGLAPLDGTLMVSLQNSAF